MPATIADQIKALVDGRSLGADGAAATLALILDGGCPPEQVAGFLTALAAKGPTTEELVGLLDAMSARAVPLELPTEVLDRAVDVVGTGGDSLGSINVSTIAGLVVAGTGVPVVKHGSRKASSLVGAADLLETLGVAIAPDPEVVARCVVEAGFGFCFAPMFHPALAAVAPVRAALGIRTVFNYLGPMANPARVRHLLLGVSDPLLVDVMAVVVAERGARRVIVVRGDDGLDEVSVSGATRVVTATCDATGLVEISASTVSPGPLGIATWPLEAIRGGDRRHNADVARSVLDGDRGAPRDVVVLNAAAALVAAGKCSTIKEGIADAVESIDSKSAARVLADVVRLSGG